jgi:hypothetical protein
MSVPELTDPLTEEGAGTPPMAAATLPPPSTAAPTASVREFLGWVTRCPRSYADTMAAWQTSCPRNSIWEDALEADLVRLENGDGRPMGEARVTLTPRGRALLAASGRAEDA